MGLFDKLRKKKWENEDPKVRMEGVEELLNSNKKGMEKQEILKGIAKNDPDSAVRLLAVQNLNGEELNEEIALNDSDWKVRKAAVENLIAYVKSNKRYFGDTHYSVNESYMNFLEKVGKNDSNSEVRDAANKIVNDPNYSKKALDKMQEELHKDDVKKINYTVSDLSKNTEKKIVLTQNDKFEYVYEANSVNELLDCCFGGDIITITYDNSSGVNKENYMIVDYNILDKQVPYPNKIPIEGTNYDRIVTYDNIDTQNFTTGAFLSNSDKAYNLMMIPLVKACIYGKNRMFSVKVGDEIAFKGMDFERTSFEGGVPDLSKVKSNLTPDQMIKHFKFKVKKIEFICRKVEEMPKSENMTIYRE